MFDNVTIGQFSDDPETTSPGLEFPANYAGIHVLGLNSLWARGSLVDSCVFEANQAESRDCILLEVNNKYNQIFGATFSNCVVQIADGTIAMLYYAVGTRSLSGQQCRCVRFTETQLREAME